MESQRLQTAVNEMSLPRITAFPSSDRIALRVPDERDVDLNIDASTDDLIPQITTVDPGCTDVQAREFIERQQGRPDEGQGWSLTIVDGEHDVPVGNLFINCRSLDLGAVEIGYWIGPSHRGHGYAAEALAVVRDWVPNEFGFDRLTLLSIPKTRRRCEQHNERGFAWRRPMTDGSRWATSFVEWPCGRTARVGRSERTSVTSSTACG